MRSQRRGRVFKCLLFSLLVLVPATAQASDMGLLLPYFYIPVNVLVGAMAFIAGQDPRPTELTWGAILARLVYLGAAAFGLLMAMIAMSYLLDGNYAGEAATCVLSYLFLLAGGVYTRRPRRPIAFETQPEA